MFTLDFCSVGLDQQIQCHPSLLNALLLNECLMAIKLFSTPFNILQNYLIPFNNVPKHFKLAEFNNVERCWLEMLNSSDRVLYPVLWQMTKNCTFIFPLEKNKFIGVFMYSSIINLFMLFYAFLVSYCLPCVPPPSLRKWCNVRYSVSRPSLLHAGDCMKWVPVTYCWGYPCDGLASHPGGVAILSVASCYGNRVMLQSCGPSWLVCDFTSAARKK